jgi:hypothetical protein
MRVLSQARNQSEGMWQEAMFFRNVSLLRTYYTALYPKKKNSSG